MNRRDFLKRSAGAVVACALPPVPRPRLLIPWEPPYDPAFLRSYTGEWTWTNLGQEYTAYDDSLFIFPI